MKRFVRYFCALLLAVIGLALVNDALVVCLMRHTTACNASKLARLWENPEPDEIAIFGSSRAQGHLLPSQIATNCFNYGVDGMGMAEVTFLLETAAKRQTKAPVLINLDPWGLTGADMPHMVGDYRLALGSGRVTGTERIPGIRFYGALRSTLTSWLNERKSITKCFDHGAIVTKMRRTAEEWEVLNAKQTAWPFVCEEEVARRFEAALKSFAPRRVFVIVAPCCSRFMELYSSEQAFKAYLAHLAQIPNVAILNLYGSKDFTDDDFFDPIHLNYDGALKLSMIVHKRADI